MIGLAVGLLLIFVCFTQSIRVTKIEVPRYLMIGETTALRCHFNLDNEKLYSLTWWKDDRQFYQYIPKNDPKMVVYKVPGVQVNALKSNLHTVEVNNIKKSSAGEYRCEVVGEAPTFNTQIRGANLSIIDPPDGPPVVRGIKQMYHPGEIVRLNCTSYRSWPAPKVTWEIVSGGKASTILSTLSSSPPLPEPLPIVLSPSSLISSSSLSSSSLHDSSFTSPQSSSLKSPVVDSSSTSTFSSLITSTFSLASHSSSNLTKLVNRSYSSNFQHNKLTASLLRHHTSSSTHAPFATFSKYVLKCRKKRNNWGPRRKGKNSLLRRTFKRNERDAERPLVTNTKISPTNYTEVVGEHLIKYPHQKSEDTKPAVYSVTLGIQFPASLIQSSDGQFLLRCRSSIHPYDWATEVRINIAAVPVADPQQLPTLHGTGSPRSRAASLNGKNMTFYLLSILVTIIYCIKL